MIRGTTKAWSTVRFAAISAFAFSTAASFESTCLAQLAPRPVATSAADRASRSQDSEIPWLSDLQVALNQSAQTGRPVLVHFYSNNCVPCKMLDQRAFKDVHVVESMSRTVIPVKINVDRNREIADKYGVIRWPTDLYLLPNGEEIHRNVSPQDPVAYVQGLERISIRNRDWIAANSAPNRPDVNNNMATIRKPAVPPDGSPRLQAFQTGVPVVHESQQFVAGQMAAPTGYQDASSNPYCIDQEAPFDPTVQASKVPLHFASHATQYGNGNVQQQPAGQASPQQYVNPNAYAAQQQPKTVSQTAGGNASATLAGVASEDLSPGFDGCCPVTLQTKSEWVPGSNQFAVKHRGRIYHCISETARTEFLRDPDHYSPVLSGYDIVHFMETGELVSGKRENGCWFQNRVFLFSTSDNRAFFDQHALQYTKEMKLSGAQQKVANGTNVDTNRR